MNFKKLFLLFCLSLSGIAYGEFLVVEKSGAGPLVPVVPGHRDTQKIADILLAYQWPMVAMNSQLTEQERDELLSPDVPYAEENFIRRKLQQLGNYDVIFIPTVLYELFCLSESSTIDTKRPYADEPAIPLHKAVNDLILGIEKVQLFDSIQSVEQKFLITAKWRSVLKGQSSRELYRELFLENYINDSYRFINDLFYKKNEAFFYLNEQLFNFFQEAYPEIQKSIDTYSFSREIEVRAYECAFRLINLIFLKGLKKEHSELQACLKKEINPVGLIPTDTIAQTIELEYRARGVNKGLLMRGSNPFLQPLFDRVRLCASTLYLESSWQYKNKAMSAYSLSYGNSLFAGVMYDETACSYHHLSNFYGDTIRGHALFIDKKEYVLNHNNHLFMVAPLVNLAALFSQGEFFHSRTKTTALWKETIIKGLCFEGIVHHPRLLIIRRDPLEHERLFQQFFLENACIITSSRILREGRTLLEEEVRADHLQVLKFYSISQRLSRFLLSSAKKIKIAEVAGPAPAS